MFSPCFDPPFQKRQFVGPVGIDGELVLASVRTGRIDTRALLVVNETKRRDNVAAFIYRAALAERNRGYDRAVKGV